MASPAIRTYQLARALTRDLDVTVVAPPGSDVGGVSTVTAPRDPAALARLLARFDAVVAQKLPVPTMRRLARSSARAVYDLYTPSLPEVLASAARSGRALTPLERLDALGQHYALATGNAFVCAAERHRDYWLGVLGDLGRLAGALEPADRPVRRLIDVVPFGVPAEQPVRTREVLRDVVPGIGRDDAIVLWSGGIVDWSDPVTPIRAVARVAASFPGVRLVFLGAPQDGEGTAAGRAAQAAARELGLIGTTVFFLPWVPYDERSDYLLEADIGVAAFQDSYEHRLANRARLLDYVWVGLPIVTTVGDVVGDVVAERGLGAAVPAGDVDAFADSLTVLLANEPARERASRELARWREELTWPGVVRPLVELLRVAGEPVEPPPEALFLRGREVTLRARVATATRLRRVRAPAG